MPIPFPPVEKADPKGLLTCGGELSSAQVWLAHQSGIFPWFNDDDPILWWAPNPRGVLFSKDIHISRSLKKLMRQMCYEIRFDSVFDRVIHRCATIHGETWINKEIYYAYTALYEQGRAHSCELWENDTLVGGLYGVCLNRVFCAESMFSEKASVSKIVLVELCRYLENKEIYLIDTQFLSEHLSTMGAIEIPRQTYMQFLDGNPDRLRGSWNINDHP